MPSPLPHRCPLFRDCWWLFSVQAGPLLGWATLLFGEWMGRRLAQWSLSHHFLSCCSSGRRLQTQGELQAALQGWIVQALCCGHIAFSHTVTSQRLSATERLLPGVGGLSLASTVPLQQPSGSSSLTAAGHHRAWVKSWGVPISCLATTPGPLPLPLFLST